MGRRKEEIGIIEKQDLTCNPDAVQRKICRNLLYFFLLYPKVFFNEKNVKH